MSDGDEGRRGEYPVWLMGDSDFRLPTVVIRRHHRAMEGTEGGGAEARVFEDTTGRFWMVKAPNNPQDGQVLASEFVAAVVGGRLSAAMPPAAICELSDAVVVGLKFGNGVEWQAGHGFGSELLVSSPPMFAKGTHDPIVNAADLAAVVAVDTLLGAHDGRQARACPDQGGWAIWAVDFGHDIGPGSWNRSTLEGRADPVALEDPNDWFGHSTPQEWTELAERISAITDDDLAGIVAAIPSAWGPPDDDRSALVACLVRRREAVVTLIRQRIKDEEAKP
jgi:hypothetical protein